MYLYKYRSLAGNNIDWVAETISKSTLRFGSVLEFNDPFDSAPIYDLKGGETEVRKYFMQMFSQRSPGMGRAERRRIAKLAANPLKRQALLVDLDKGMRSEVAKLAVYCLSEVRDNILMWAHYADSHKGVCLRFKASSSTPFFGRAQQVNYQIDRPKVDPIHNSRDDQTRNALLTKADYWSYEKEWRIVDYLNPPGVVAFPEPLLDGIILGARIDTAAERQLRSEIAARTHAMEIFRASLDSSSFWLNIVAAP